MGKDLGDIRSQLDELDQRILDALGERHAITDRVARLKAESGKPVRDLAREQDQLTRLTRMARDRGLDSYYVTRLFTEILDHSVRYQQEHLADVDNPQRRTDTHVTVAYQGTDGAYSQMAAEKHFAPRQLEVTTRGYENFRAMLEAVQSGACRYGVLPVENTTVGSIVDAYDLMARMDLSVVGEEVWHVEHCLIAISDIPIDQIRRIYSQPPALAQCSNFLRELSDCTVESFTDTAKSVERVRDENEPTHAAIASEKAAALYGLPVIRRDIANQRGNYTRFMIVARSPFLYDERVACKTSLIFATKDEEGALLKCLNVLASHGLNLTKLESRPRPNVPWEYLFYVDFEGNVENPEVSEALQEVRVNTSFFKLLGSYPSRTTRETRPARPQGLSQARPSLPVDRPSPVSVGDVVVGGEQTVIIAGPPMVESREQLMACARAAKDAGADILRGGCYRHPSADDEFEGLGEEGLSILADVGKAVGMPVLTEVIRSEDVEAAAQYADVLHVGGRNMLNLALLERVGRVDRPVLLRRGLVTSLEQWLEAAQHVLDKGNQQLMLSERGVRSLDPSARNVLDLACLPMLREQSAHPLLVEPGGAAQHARWVAPLCEAAVAAGAQGLMLNIHPDPDNARGSLGEPLDLEAFRTLLARLRGEG